MLFRKLKIIGFRSEVHLHLTRRSRKGDLPAEHFF